MRKYIFLDFDGVLNTENYIKALREQGHPMSDKYGFYFDPTAVTNLAVIIEKTKAEIVISSSWKTDGLDRMKKMWIERNLPGKVIDITPSDFGMEEIDFSNPDDFVGRGREIQRWIQQNGSAKDRYVILDDLDDMLQSQYPFFIQTDPRIGITEIDAKKAIDILNIEDKEGIGNKCETLFSQAVKFAKEGNLEAAINVIDVAIPLLKSADCGYEYIYMLGFYCQINLEAKHYDKAKTLFDLGMRLIEKGEKLKLNLDSYQEDIDMFLDLRIMIKKMSENKL